MLSETSRGDTFEQLALPLFPSLYNHAFWLTHDQAEAEDLVQETFSKALGAFDSFQPGTNFKAWAIRILRNTFLTTRTGLAASRTVFLEHHPEKLDTPAGPLRKTISSVDNLAALHLALEQVPPQLREVLLLCDVEEIKYKDIALILDVPIGTTVMSRVSRGRRTLPWFVSRVEASAGNAPSSLLWSSSNSSLRLCVSRIARWFKSPNDSVFA
jgi:RNA polymerase sigma-70 factor (ECF subfamily)